MSSTAASYSPSSTQSTRSTAASTCCVAMGHLITAWKPVPLPVPPAFVTAGGQRGSSSDTLSGWYSGRLFGREHERVGVSQRRLVTQATTTMSTPVWSTASRWLPSPSLTVRREEWRCCADRRRRTSRVRSRDSGALCGESRGERTPFLPATFAEGRTL